MARKMKDSGIEWIGEIPEGWETINPKALFTQRKDRALKGERQLTSSQQYGILYQDEYMELTGSKVVTVEKDFDILKHVEAGDFVISMRSFQGGLEYSTKSGAISSAYVMLVPNLELVYPRFYRWLLKSSVYIDALQRTTNMVRDGQAMRYSNFAQVRLFTLPLDEQKSRADFLDLECSSIDKILFKTRSSIEEYKKLKQAVITQAVIKGVRGDREMKDSGVEWIGEIPKDWEIKRLKSFCTIVDCKNRTPDVFPDGKYTVVRTTCIKDCSFSYEGSYQTDTTNFKAWTLKGQPHKGDIFFTREAPVGEACLVPNADNLCMGQRVMFFRPEDNSDARYIMYSIYGPLVREYIASKNSGSTVGHLKLGQVACIPIFYCPPLEQKEIANYLDAKCAEIDGLIAKKEQLVKELESYKRSLIYEVVTGKREV